MSLALWYQGVLFPEVNPDVPPGSAGSSSMFLHICFKYLGALPQRGAEQPEAPRLPVSNSCSSDPADLTWGLL